MSQAEAAQVSAQPVRDAIQSLADREQHLITNVGQARQSLLQVVDLVTVLGEDDKLQAYHEIMKSLGQLNHEIAAHKDVVTRFSQTYKPTLKTTAFGDVLDEKLQARLQQQPYNPRADEDLQAFQTAAGLQEEGGRGDEGDGQDEDIEVLDDGGQRWASEKCPVSMKEVLSLTEPVKDSRGYVYEKSSVLEYLRGHGNGARHPVAGVQGILTREELKPADEVLRAIRRNKLDVLFGNDKGRGQGKEAEEVLDV